MEIKQIKNKVDRYTLGQIYGASFTELSNTDKEFCDKFIGNIDASKEVKIETIQKARKKLKLLITNKLKHQDELINELLEKDMIKLERYSK